MSIDSANDSNVQLVEAGCRDISDNRISLTTWVINIVIPLSFMYESLHPLYIILCVHTNDTIRIIDEPTCHLDAFTCKQYGLKLAENCKAVTFD